MLKDPATHWPDGFPYDLLAPAGITPNSSMKEVRDAGYTLMDHGGMTPEARKAWDTLRRPVQRLMVDFFLYQSDSVAGLIMGPNQAGEEDAYGHAA